LTQFSAEAFQTKVRLSFEMLALTSWYFLKINQIKMKASKIGLQILSPQFVDTSTVDPIYSTDQLMALLNVSRRTVQKWRDTGTIEYSAIGYKMYYRHSSVMQMIVKFSVKPYSKDGKTR
jgi:hypothetical protein